MLAFPSMLVLAVTAFDKLRHLPRRDLVNVGLFILVLIIGIVLIKLSARMNKWVLFGILFVTTIVVGLAWVYERNEPKFLTPVIDQIAPFFPTKPSYKR
jgi:membrane-bound ClpP family serine protease